MKLILRVLPVRFPLWRRFRAFETAVRIKAEEPDPPVGIKPVESGVFSVRRVVKKSRWRVQYHIINNVMTPDSAAGQCQITSPTLWLNHPLILTLFSSSTRRTKQSNPSIRSLCKLHSQINPPSIPC